MPYGDWGEAGNHYDDPELEDFMLAGTFTVGSLKVW
jgi:hypothetical protein